MPMQTSILYFDQFELDLNSYELRKSGRVIKLEKLPTELLIFLAESQGQLVTREQIIQAPVGRQRLCRYAAGDQHRDAQAAHRAAGRFGKSAAAAGGAGPGISAPGGCFESCGGSWPNGRSCGRASIVISRRVCAG